MCPVGIAHIITASKELVSIIVKATSDLDIVIKEVDETLTRSSLYVWKIEKAIKQMNKNLISFKTTYTKERS